MHEIALQSLKWIVRDTGSSIFYKLGADYIGVSLFKPSSFIFIKSNYRL